MSSNSQLNTHQSNIMKTLVKNLTCPVCRVLLDNPSYLSCGHNFCSACLEDSFFRENSCPVCRIPAQPCDAIRCHAMGSIVTAFGRFNDYLERSAVVSANQIETAEALASQFHSAPLPPLATAGLGTTTSSTTTTTLEAEESLLVAISAGSIAVTTMPPTASLDSAVGVEEEEEKGEVPWVVVAAETCREEEFSPISRKRPAPVCSPTKKGGFVPDSLNQDSYSEIVVENTPRHESQAPEQNNIANRRGVVIADTFDEDDFYAQEQEPEPDSADWNCVLSSSEPVVLRTALLATGIENDINRQTTRDANEEGGLGYDKKRVRGETKTEKFKLL